MFSRFAGQIYAAPIMKYSILSALRCPRCAQHLDLTADIVCSGCGQHYPRLGGIPILLRDPQAYLRSCRAQLALLGQQTERTVRAIDKQMLMPDVLRITKTRCSAVIQAVQDQARDIRAILDPVLGESSGEMAA